MRTSENARRMVVFFGAPHPKDGGIRLGGTGFLVVHKEQGFGFGYLVTARHVAEKVQPKGNVIVRINKKDGEAEPRLIDEILWAYHPDKTVDIAVSPAYVSKSEYDVGYYNLEDLVRPSDPICIVGLFNWHSGSGRNTPIVHSGNIALLPDAKEKIPIRNRTTGASQFVEAYLVEAQTFDGLSGAPVFQREYVALDKERKHNGGPAPRARLRAGKASGQEARPGPGRGASQGEEGLSGGKTPRGNEKAM